MTKKDIFVSEINAILANGATTLSEDAAAYFETLQALRKTSRLSQIMVRLFLLL